MAGGDDRRQRSTKRVAPAKKNVLSEKEIKWIMSRKPMPAPRRYAELTPRAGRGDGQSKRRLYVVAKAFFSMEERLPKLQEWVREQLATKGKVEVDDDWVKWKAEGQEIINRKWPEIEARIQAICLNQSQTGCQDDEQSD